MAGLQVQDVQGRLIRQLGFRTPFAAGVTPADTILFTANQSDELSGKDQTVVAFVSCEFTATAPVASLVITFGSSGAFTDWGSVDLAQMPTNGGVQVAASAPAAWGPAYANGTPFGCHFPGSPVLLIYLTCWGWAA